MKIYHNPRCRKSREGLSLATKKFGELEIYEYLKEGIDAKNIKKLSLQLNLDISEMIRTQEDFFKKELKGKNFSKSEWIQIVADNPKLLKRPILVSGNKAKIIENADDIKYFE